MLRSVPFRPDPIADTAGRTRPDQLWLGLCLAASIVTHVGVGIGLPRRPPARPAPVAISTEIVDLDLPERTKPPPPPDETPDPAATRVNEREDKVLPRREARAPQPSAAAQVLTRSDEPSDALDLLDTIVTGPATTFSAHSSGRSSGTPAPTAAPSGSGERRSQSNDVVGPDRSRPASLAGGFAWTCPFPPEADVADVDRADVSLRIDIDASGRARQLRVVSDPGHGFGAAAQACAAQKHYTPGLDRDGNPVASTLAVRVRFVR